MKEKTQLLQKLHEHKVFLEDNGYTVLYVGLYGSQNYNLADERSDVDSRAIIMPTVKDLLKRKSTSKVYNVDGGQVDVKDLASFLQVVRKGNPAYTEVVHTDYWVGDEELKNILMFYKTNARAVLGMMREKRAAVIKGLPTSCELVKTMGYDPKQVHHARRLYDVLHESPRVDLLFAHYYEDPTEMLKVKREGVGTKEEALAYMDKYILEVEEELEDYVFEQIGEEYNEQVYDYLEKQLKQELCK